MTITTDHEIAASYSNEDVYVGLCPRYDHLRAARQWRRACQRCGQPIAHGNVGPRTWDTDARCDFGFHQHQHGCGEWNPPTEVTIDPYEYESIEATCIEAMRLLRVECEAQADAADNARRAELCDELRDALDGVDLLREEHITPTGSEEQPGVWVNYDGEWEAWDYSAAADREDVLIVTESELYESSTD